MLDNVKNIDNVWDILKDTGLNILTGESCAYGMRLLCDITPACESLLSEFFGGNVAFHAIAWNARGCLHSVMLTRNTITDFAYFSLLREYALVVDYDIDGQKCVRCYLDQSDYDNEIKDHPFLKDATFRLQYGNKNNRNQHMFSGRIS